MLEGQGVGQFFRVDRYSGLIELVNPVDRDPPNGVPVWKFIVQAIDNNGTGLVGYADVQVRLKDINDNSPLFPSETYATVMENSDPETFVTQVFTLFYNKSIFLMFF